MISRAYQFFGRRVRVDCDDPAVADLLDAIYDRQRVAESVHAAPGAATPGAATATGAAEAAGPATPSDPTAPSDRAMPAAAEIDGPPDLVVAVHAEGPGGPRVEVGGRTIRAPSGAELAHHAHLVLVNAAAALADGRRVLHAGAVARGGRAVLIVGRSGWGKTTQTLALVQRGWRLLSDDFAVVRPDGEVEPFVRRVNLTAASLELLDVAAPFDTPVVAGFGGRAKWMVDAERLWPGCLGDAARLAAICVLAPADAAPAPGAAPQPTPASDTDPAPRGGRWHLEVDHLPAGLVTDLVAIPGVVAVDPTAGEAASGYRIVVHTTGAARIVAALDAACATHDVAILSAHAGPAPRPDFVAAPVLAPADLDAAVNEILAHDLSLAGRRFLFGTRPTDVLAARVALRAVLAGTGAQVYRLSPGPVAATAALIAGLLDDAPGGSP